jgi:hypothetical protein
MTSRRGLLFCAGLWALSVVGCADVLGADFDRTPAGAQVPSGSESSGDNAVERSSAEDGGNGRDSHPSSDPGTPPQADRGCESSRMLCGGSCFLRTDTHHCGSCDTVCPLPANGRATCDGKECAIACDQGFAPSGGGCAKLVTCYPDADGDGFGDPAGAASLPGSCPATWVTKAGDCDDTDSAAYPGATNFHARARANGSYDFNCDGVEETAVNEVLDCTDVTDLTQCESSLPFAPELASGTVACGHLISGWPCVVDTGACVADSRSLTSYKVGCR